MSSFLANASKRVTDVRGFIRDAATGSSIKYVAEKGAKHLLYIPFITNTVVDEATGQTMTVKEPVAISGNIHEWQTPDGKFHAVVCLKDVIRNAEDGTVLNDGTCPICDRVNDAWEIVNYRKEQEEAQCKLAGDDRKKYLEKTFMTFRDERKAKAARSYMYLLVVKFHIAADGNPVISPNGLPEYDLKVMKMSSSRIEKIQQQMSNSGIELPGSELMIEYPNTDDRRLQVSQSTTAPIFPNNMLTLKYPALVEAINQDVAKFSWDSIEKSFSEWSGMSTAVAKNTMDSLFEKWDQYRKEAMVNPSARYLEYVTTTPTTEPALHGLGAPSIPGAVPNTGAPVIPGATAEPAPGAPVIPGGAPVIPGVTPNAGAPVIPGTAPAAPAAPAAPNTAPDVNNVFGGTGSISI